MKPITEPCSNAVSRRPADWRPGVRLAIALIRVYQILISPYFTGSCRFLPSCSAYTAEAIDRHGVIRGGWLAARRLLRCHPLCTAGHDPVPL